jgi:peptidoglycan/LPS O-acetylase OafA/YrhL
MGNQLVYLDRLRAIAVIGVIMVHTAQFSFANLNHESGAASAVFTILSSGRFGVGVFFLLSGFLLSYLYEAPSAKKTTKQYFLARFLRVWPLWILFSISWVTIYYFSSRTIQSPAIELEWILLGLTLSAFFLLWLSPTHFENFIGGAWSIQIEVFCYVLFAWLRGKSVRTLLAFAIFINIVGVGLAFTGDLEGVGVLDALRRLSVQTGTNFFILGWLMARVFSRLKVSRPTNGKTEAESLQESFRSVFSGHEWLLIFWLGTFLFAPAIYGSSIEAVGFVIIAVVLAHVLGKLSLVSRFLQMTGKLSYFLFFMHFVVLYFVDIAIPEGSRPETLGAVLAMNLGLGVLVFLLCLGPALLSLRFFEQPLMSIAKKR